MALSLRAASGGQNGSSTVSSQVITLPTGTVTGDLVYFVVSINATASAPTLSGWTLTLTTDATNTVSTIVGYRTIQSGDADPTVSWTGTAKASWTAIGLSPPAGNVATHYGFGVVLNSGSAGTSFTPNTFPAGTVTGASVLLTGSKTSTTTATGITATAPTNWVEPTNGDQTTAITAGANQVAVEVSLRASDTGTVTPTAITLSQSSFALVSHAFAVENVATRPLNLNLNQAVNRAAYY